MDIFSKKLLLSACSKVKWENPLQIPASTLSSTIFQGITSTGGLRYIFNVGDYQLFSSANPQTFNYYNMARLKIAITTSSCNLVGNISGGYYFGWSHYTDSSANKLFYRTKLNASPSVWSMHNFTASNSRPTFLCKIGNYYYMLGVQCTATNKYNALLVYTSTINDSSITQLYKGSTNSSSYNVIAEYWYFAPKNYLFCTFDNNHYYYVNGGTTLTPLNSGLLYDLLKNNSAFYGNYYITNDRLTCRDKIYKLASGSIFNPTLEITFDATAIGGYTGNLGSQRICPIGSGNKALGVFNTYVGPSRAYSNNIYWTFYDGSSWSTPEIVVRNIPSTTNPVAIRDLVSSANGAVAFVFDDYSKIYYTSTDSFIGEA